ncbi:hypothetical protein N7537_008663 [Penicillium hordei]|uniref:Uncharacterized protein n=1 Tax=Penicillium hordei TaxID=40994 RepID=A0AAD6H126_9EURO|nr:uncharacterized protein N7537_008663 [Penicillium hordei]KAJ5598579.1 hypothetical protein N7537_008663 [Penicillium hordei]
MSAACSFSEMSDVLKGKEGPRGNIGEGIVFNAEIRANVGDVAQDIEELEVDSRHQNTGFIEGSAGTSSVFVVVYYLPIYFQFVNNDGALMAAVRLLPFVVIAVVVNLISGSLLHFIKLYKVIFLIASIFLLAGGGPLVAYSKPSTTTGTLYGLSILTAVGSGLSMVTGYTVSTLTTKPEDTGAGLKLQNVAQIGGQVIALAVAGQIYRSRALNNLQSALAGHGYSYAEISGAVACAQSTLFENLEGGLRDTAVEAISQAMRMTFVLVPVAGGVMFIAALFMKWEKLFGPHVAVGG